MKVVCLFGKPPNPGKTKSRLAQTIGQERAAELSKAMLIDLSQMLNGIPAISKQFWYSPESHPDQFTPFIPEGFEYYSQMGDSLGDRLKGAFQFQFEEKGARKVIIIGSDCITLCPEVLESVFLSLDQYEVVLQPAMDGGYTLVAQAMLVEELFEDIPWGTDQVMSLSRIRLKEAGIKFQEAPLTFDIDTREDLVRLKDSKVLKIHAHTRKWIQDFFKEKG